MLGKVKLGLCLILCTRMCVCVCVCGRVVCVDGRGVSVRVCGGVCLFVCGVCDPLADTLAL